MKVITCYKYTCTYMYAPVHGCGGEGRGPVFPGGATGVVQRPGPVRLLRRLPKVGSCCWSSSHLTL